MCTRALQRQEKFVNMALQVLAMVVVVVSLVLIMRRVCRPLNLPPGPTGLPVIGSLPLLSSMPFHCLAALPKKYGALMSVSLGQAQCVIASSAETAKEFLQRQDANFCSRPRMRMGEIVLYGQDILFQDTTPLWRRLRKIFQVELTGAHRLAATTHIREEELTHLVRTLPRTCDVDLRAHLGVALTNVISRMVLNRRLSQRIDELETHDGSREQLRDIHAFRAIVDQIAECVGSFHLGDYIPAFNLAKWLDIQGLEKRFRDTNRRMDEFVTKIIGEHQARRKMGLQGDGEKDFVDLLLDEVEMVGGEKPPISMANVKAVIWDAFAGATDPVSIACEWAMSEIIHNPHIQYKAQAELDIVVGRHRRVQESDISKLPYIQAIIKEVLRLHPPIPVMGPHQSIKSCTALGYNIPAKTRLFVNVWGIGRDAAVWPNPMKFNPERFMDNGPNAGVSTNGQSFQLLPFGAGRRMCPGMALGLVTSQYCLAMLLQAFEWSPSATLNHEGPVLSRAVPSLWAVAKPRLALAFYNLS